MTSLPQLIAAFHSLVGLSAVCVSINTFYYPSSFGIGINIGSLIEMGLGTVIGAITFTGSIIAFMKLQGMLKSNILISCSCNYIISFITTILIITLAIHHKNSRWGCW